MKKFPDNINLDMSSCSESPRTEKEEKKRMEEVCNIEGISNNQQNSNATENEDSFSINDSIIHYDLLSYTQNAFEKDAPEDLEMITYNDFSMKEENLQNHSGVTLKQSTGLPNTGLLEAESTPLELDPRKKKLRTVDFKVTNHEEKDFNKELLRGNLKKRDKTSLLVTSNNTPLPRESIEEKDNNNINQPLKNQQVEENTEKNVSCDDSILLENFLKTLNLNNEEKPLNANVCQVPQKAASMQMTYGLEKDNYMIEPKLLGRVSTVNNEDKGNDLSKGRNFVNENSDLIINNSKFFGDKNRILNINTMNNKPSVINLNNNIDLPDKTDKIDKSKSTIVLYNHSLNTQSTLPLQNLNNNINFGQNNYLSQVNLNKLNNQNNPNNNNKCNNFSTNNLSNFNAFSNSSTVNASNLSTFPSTNSIPPNILRNSNNTLSNYSHLYGTNKMLHDTNLVNPNTTRYQMPFTLMNQQNTTGNTFPLNSMPLVTSNSNYSGEIKNFSEFSRQMMNNSQSNINNHYSVNRNQQGFKLSLNSNTNNNINNFNINHQQNLMNFNTQRTQGTINNNMSISNINNNNNILNVTKTQIPFPQKTQSALGTLPYHNPQLSNNNNFISNRNQQLFSNSNNALVSNPTMLGNNQNIQAKKILGNFGEKNFISSLSCTNQPIINQISNIPSSDLMMNNKPSSQSYNQVYNFGSNINSFAMNNINNINNPGFNNNNNNYQLLNSQTNKINNLFEGQIRNKINNNNNTSSTNTFINNDSSTNNTAFKLEYLNKSSNKQVEAISFQNNNNILKGTNDGNLLIQPNTKMNINSPNQEFDKHFGKLLEIENPANKIVPKIQFPIFPKPQNELPTTMKNDDHSNYNENNDFIVSNPVKISSSTKKTFLEKQKTNNNNNNSKLNEKKISNIPIYTSKGYSEKDEDETTLNNAIEVHKFSKISRKTLEKTKKEQRRGSFQHKKATTQEEQDKIPREKNQSFEQQPYKTSDFDDNYPGNSSEEKSQHLEDHRKHHFIGNRDNLRNQKKTSVFKSSNSQYNDDYRTSKYDNAYYNKKEFYYDNEYDYNYGYDYNYDYNNYGKESISNPIDLTEEIEELTIDILRNKSDIEEYINSKSGSKSVQTYLEVITPEEVKDILELISPVFLQISNNQYGNYFITRFIEYLNFKQRRKVWRKVKKALSEVCENEFGNHCVQSLINCLESSEEEVYINNLICPYFLDFSMNKYGTFILQKMLMKFSPESKSGLNKFINDNFLKLANNIYGVCVIKKYIISNKTNSDLFKFLFVDIFAIYFFDIVNHESGNYAVFCLLEEWGLELCRKLINILEENVAELGTKKYSQAIILKCLNLGEKVKRIIYIYILIIIYFLYFLLSTF